MSQPEPSRPPSPSWSRSGERDENSVLFTVKDLVKAGAARPSTAAPSQRPVPLHAAREESTGIVDLKAIAHVTNSSLALKQIDVDALRPAVVVAPQTASAQANVSTLWSGGVMRDADSPLEKVADLATGRQAPWLFAGVAAAGALFFGLTLGLGHWMFSSDAHELTATAEMPPAPASAAIEREAVVVRTKLAASADSADAPAATAARPRASSHGKKSSVAAKSKTTAPKKTKASDPCGCKGVLACVIRCQATGK